MFSITESGVTFPSGDPDESDVFLSLKVAGKAKARLVELAAVTAVKAGELSHAYIVGWREAAQASRIAARHLMRAKRTVKQAAAIVALDRAAGILKAKDLLSSRSPGGSADLRESVVALDEEVQAAEDRMEQIQAVAALLEIDAETLKMAYFTVHRLIDPRDRTSPPISGTVEDAVGVGEFTADEKAAEFAEKHRGRDQSNYTDGFGPPRI